MPSCKGCETSQKYRKPTSGQTISRAFRVPAIQRRSNLIEHSYPPSSQYILFSFQYIKLKKSDLTGPPSHGLVQGSVFRSLCDLVLLAHCLSFIHHLWLQRTTSPTINQQNINTNRILTLSKRHIYFIMPPTIVLVRHAQALHNVANKSPPISPNTSEAVRLTCFFPRSLQDHSLHDPSLSELGYSQLPALKKSLQERFGNVEPGDIAIITSPMRRCIQTALGSIDWLLEKGLKMTANADWQGTWISKELYPARFPLSMTLYYCSPLPDVH